LVEVDSLGRGKGVRGSDWGGGGGGGVYLESHKFCVP